MVAEPSTQPIEISPVAELTDEIYAAVQRLVPQLTTSTPPPTRRQLEAIIASPGAVLFIARNPDFGKQIVGMLTLILFRIPTGMQSRIEDVVVDEKARGRGIGAALTHAAIARARQAGARSIDLTSNPARQAANQLYQRLGFDRRDTNVYRLKLT